MSREFRTGARTWRLFTLATGCAMALAFATASSPVQAYAKSRPGPNPPPTSTPAGYDISYVQCPSSRPKNAAFGIVGVNNGIAWSTNPCLKSEAAWASSLSQAPAFYANTADPGPVSSHWTLPGPRTCADPTSYNDTGCAYNYGWNAANQSFGTLATTTSPAFAQSHGWWLDVETTNSWNGNAAANSADIQGAVDYLRGRKVPGVGVYSTGYQWNVITGGYALPGVADWVAGAQSARGAASMCAATFSFSGGRVALTQYPNQGFDADYRCP